MSKTLRAARLLLMLLVVTAAVPAQIEAQPAREFGFGFNNFGDPVLSWDIYRNSFYGIPEYESASAFDALFYEAVFKSTISAPGNCFGISLLSLVMNRDGGHMGFCAPPYQYSGGMTSPGSGPSDANLRRVINILHGHQLSLACITDMLDQIGGMHTQDGSVVIKRCAAIIAKEGPCILSVTKSFNPSDGGHSMIAYAVDGDKILLVDPNRLWASTDPGHRDWYQNKLNFVECGAGYWKFDMKGHGIWPSGAGHLTVYPLSVAEPTGRSPSSLGLNASELVAKIFIVSKSSGATLLQVTDERGRRLFLPGSKAIDGDTATGLRCIVPWFPSVPDNHTEPFPFELYFSIRTPQSLEVEFTTGRDGAVFGVGDTRSYATLDCATPGDTMRVMVSGIGTARMSCRVLRSSRPHVAAIP